MDCACQEVEVYDYLTNSTLILDVCANAAHCHYLVTTFTTVALVMIFWLLCTIACTSNKRRIAYIRVNEDDSADDDTRLPPQYNAI